MIAANVHALLYIFFKISSETKRTTHICQPHKCSFRRWYWELKSIVCRENMSLYSWELEGKWKMKALDLAGWPKRFFFSFRFLSVLFVQCQHWQQKYYFLRCWWWILALRTLPGGFFKSKTLFFKKKISRSWFESEWIYVMDSGSLQGSSEIGQNLRKERAGFCT